MSNTTSSHVYIIDAARTPFLKAKGRPGPFTASDLAVNAARALLLRQPFSASALDEVILGCVTPSSLETNIARIVSLRLGCGPHVPAWTVQRNCASGMQALHSAMKDIQLGSAHLVLAGGTEAMSHAPLLYNSRMVNWLADLNRSKNPGDKLKQLLRFRPRMLAPIIALLNGLTDHTINLSMGQTAENIAFKFNISRNESDAYALRSHQRAHAAHQAEHFDKIVTLFDQHGHIFDHDDGVRTNTSLEKLNTLNPYFDKKYGIVTAGNSAQITDGAAVLLLASEHAVKTHQLPVLGRLVDCEWAGVEPSEMGLGPAHAIPPLLQRNNLVAGQINAWEINEAFAAQVLACLAAWRDKAYCQAHFGLDRAFGDIKPDHLNIDGGAIALGHPVGASGARITLQCLNTLQRQNARFGVASLCIGGGQGGALLIERLT